MVCTKVGAISSLPTQEEVIHFQETQREILNSLSI
jgi:hypothetical protein